MAYSCSGGINGTLTLTDGQTKTVSNLPLGSTCTLSEGQAGHQRRQLRVGTETWAPSNSVTIVANNTNNTVGVTLSNPLTRVLVASR